MVWGRRYREGLLRCLPVPPGPIVLPGDWPCWWRVLGEDWLQAVADGGHVMRGGWETWEGGREGEERGKEKGRERREGREGRKEKPHDSSTLTKKTPSWLQPILLLLVADVLKW